MTTKKKRKQIESTEEYLMSSPDLLYSEEEAKEEPIQKEIVKEEVNLQVKKGFYRLPILEARMKAIYNAKLINDDDNELRFEGKEHTIVIKKL